MQPSHPIVPALFAAVLVATPAIPALAHDVTATANTEINASFDVLSAKAETKGNTVTFSMTTRGSAGATKPKATGKFAGSSVYAYVWPTKVDPEAVGFEKGSGILAAAVTAHPDFNDEPLFANKGGEWHFHWVVLTKDASCGPAGLKVRDIEPGTKPKLPKTWPGAAIFIDSPGYQPRFKTTTVNVTVPFDSPETAASVAFDGVTTALKVNGNLHAPLLCVSDVFKIGSGDLSLPGKAMPAK
ncbi:MAG: hypothetical protein KJS95_13400 [Gammaproteobacteria bacterium]|nr:hypothetical protein [Gammaproteobacteria bacterium]